MRHVVAFLMFAAPLGAADPIETPAEAKLRHERVAERRRGTDIICHRGASEFAQENTLEAFRATFELGGDGNEIDIRATKDGVLVCFHDDMLDRHLEAYGDVADWPWEHLQLFPALEHLPGQATEKLCRDYLALTDEDARTIGPPQFEAAARALLAVSPKTETALELMKHRLQSVRGRAILDCLAHAKEPWAKGALEKGAPHALAYIPPK